MRIPVTSHVADYHGWEIDEYGTCEVDFEPGMGKLSKLIHELCDDLQESSIAILEKESQECKIIKEHSGFISSSRSFVELEERIDRVQKNLDRTKITHLKHHDILYFEWMPLDCIATSPSSWFAREIYRAREMGLIFQINGHPVPETVMASMGTKLVAIAQNKNLL